MASGPRPDEGRVGRLVACGQRKVRSSPGRKESEQQEAVRTAEKLLREFYPHTTWGQTQLRLLQGLCLLATGEKANVESALGTFIDMAQAEVRRLAGEGVGGVGDRRSQLRRLPPTSRAEGQRPRAAGRGAGLRAAEADP